MVSAFRPKSLLVLLDAVVEPRAAFQQLRAGWEAWYLPTILYGCLAGVISLAAEQSVIGANAAAFHVPAGKLAILDLAAKATLFLTPVLLIFRVFIISYLIWIGMLFVNAEIKWSAVLSVVGLAQVVYVIHIAVSLITLKLTGSSPHIVCEIGLNLLINGPPQVQYLLAIFNPFSAWYLYIIARGVGAIGQMSTRNALVAISPYCITYLALSFAVSFFVLR